MGDFRIAFVQTVPLPGDVAGNLEQHLALIQEASRESPEAIVFPELSLTGYELLTADELAFSADDGRLAPLREAAEAGLFALVVGAPVRVNDKLYNGALLLGPDGTARVHGKQFLGSFGEEARVDGELPPGEPSIFVPGAEPEYLSLSAGSAAIAICAEANRPEHASHAASQNARAYLACSFVIPSEYEVATRNLRKRAIDHSMLVGFANFGGPSGGLRSAGGTSAWAPGGELLAKLPSEGVGVLTVACTRGQWRGAGSPRNAWSQP